MQFQRLRIVSNGVLWLSFGVALGACGAQKESDVDASGGQSATSGGATNASTGGATASGGAANGSGGKVASGGASSSSGGASSSNGGASSSSGGAVANGGATSSAGGKSSGGASSSNGGAVASGGATSGAGGKSSGGATGTSEHFSFFVTSLKALQQLSGSQSGFGGDLRFGETGAGAGLRGADKICATIAESSMAGAGSKTWRAFLSATDDGNGAKVNAIDRIGSGPWYDRLGRVVAATKADLLHDRPTGANTAIINDLPNEEGTPNHNPDGTGQVDNHDTLTGTNDAGQLYGANSTCKDWTSADGATGGKPRVGHTWPRNVGGTGGPTGGGGGNMANWMSALDEAGCAPGVNLIEMGGPNPSNPTVGSGGGYGGFYCFALTP